MEGLRELRSLGFVHRDIKPENIVINFEPLTAVLIDFGTATLTTSRTKGFQAGTKGYYPDTRDWEDGSDLYDIWAVGAVIMEADMPFDEYYHTPDEKVAKTKA